MPYKIVKVRNKECYKVVNINNGYEHSKCTTREKAQKQVNLLHRYEKTPAGMIRPSVLKK